MTEPTKIQQKMLDKDFGVASFKFNRWSAELGELQTIDDALQPRFWAGQADKIMGHDKTKPKGRGDIIEVRQHSTGLYAELLVTEVGTGFIKTILLRQGQPKDVTIPEGSPLTTRWNVGKRCHEVIRVSDKLLMASDFQTKASAAAWIGDHMKAMAA